jgi:predicted branched-subunit amino acid permease
MTDQQRFQWIRQPAAVLGVRESLPSSLAMATWGLVTGVAMVQSGLSTAQAIGMTLLVYAGSAQLTSLPLLAASAPLAIIWASALIVNLRFVIYSAAVKPFFQRLPWGSRLLYSIGTVDVLSVNFLRRYPNPPVHQPSLVQSDTFPAASEPLAYFRWAAGFNWLVWQTSSIAGILLAHVIPLSWGLEYVASLALIAMLLPMLLDRASLVCVGVAAVVAVLAVKLPLNLGLLIAVIAGVFAAMLVDGRPGSSGLTASRQDS